MRIKQLELCGFKSFADPTVLDFSAGVSGIVGPNGCGKSNIIDGLRWVLGEQSPSRLRGDVMEAVIFNGTETRGPAGMAEVSLLLENDGTAFGSDDVSEAFRELRDVPEILVTRRYFRSGEAEYMINRRTCRLRDITELFLGTGVGTKGYSIVQQGRVNQLVDANPQDLRLFIEEAAGTTLYRGRRLAAERKLERTLENLGRVSDILREKERQITWLQRMAKKAERHRVVFEELRHAELQLARRTYERLLRDGSEAAAREAALRQRDVAVGDEISRLDAERVDARSVAEALEGRVDEGRERVYRSRSFAEQGETRIGYFEREDRDSGERLAAIEQERESLGGRAGSLRSALVERREKLAHSERERILGEESLEGSRLAVAARSEEANALGVTVNDRRGSLADLSRRETELNSRAANASEQCTERQGRAASTAAEADAARSESASLASAFESVETKTVELESQREALTTARDAARGERDELQAQRSSLEAQHLDWSGRLAEQRSKLAAAEEVEADYGRYGEGVRAIMRREDRDSIGVLDLVGEVIEAPEEYERAVAAVLGDRLQHIVIDDPAHATEAIAALRGEEAGRCSFVPLHPRNSAGVSFGATQSALAPDEDLVPLLGVVRVDPRFAALAEMLLGNAVVVASLDEGVEIWKRNGRVLTLVTRDGDVLFPDGVATGGSAPPLEARLLAQRRETKRLRVDVADAEAQLAETTRRRSDVAAALDAVSARTKELEERSAEVSLAQVEAKKDLQRLGEARTRVEEALKRHEQRRDVAIREAAELEAVAASARNEAAEAATQRESIEGGLVTDEARLAELRQEVEQGRRQMTDLELEVVKAREMEEGLREGMLQMETRLSEFDSRLEVLVDEAREIRRRGEIRRRESAELREALAANAEKLAEAEAELAEQSAAADESRRSIEGLESRLGELRRDRESVREQLSRIDVASAERRMTMERCQGQVAERYRMSLEQVELDDGDEANYRERAAELRPTFEKLDRGQVGADAFEELESLETLRNELASQRDDLEEAVANLQKTIANLNRSSRDRFATTFESIRDLLAETFPKLFGGGRARLFLTDAADMLETGVDIEAQPPGMNVRTLSLLSGGQKALTAVSLIFSIFLHRPSPFCVLDEVDAPLDDANIDRFNAIVQEMGQTSQFLLITHNKRTMEIVDTLYGVTMEEPGVSKIVSVELERSVA